MVLFKLGSSNSVPVTAFRLLAGLKPLNRSLSVLDLSFCRLDNLVFADPNMKVHNFFCNTQECIKVISIVYVFDKISSFINNISGFS